MSPQAPAAVAAAGATAPAQYATDATEGVFAECFKLAFGVAKFDYQILGEHAAVLARVASGAGESVHQREYFPRRPLLLPKLLQTLNDSASTRKELVQLILEDPSLADNVLRQANSAFYRVRAKRIDSLDSAVTVLGTDGLRRIMATAILQPVFRLPSGYFERFAATTWEQAQRCAVSAQAYAAATRSADPLVAQLLGLVGALARIVLFKLTMDTYREYPGSLPRAEVFIRAIQSHETRTAQLIASTWELSAPSMTALHEQADEISPAAMSALGRAAYAGKLCGTLALLNSNNLYPADSAQALLVEQGVPREVVEAMWQAAISAGKEA